MAIINKITVKLKIKPKVWWWEEAELAVRDRRRARSEAHPSEAHRFAFTLRRHGECPQCSPGPEPRPGRPPLIIFHPAQIPVLCSTYSTLLLSGMVHPATRNFQALNPLRPLLALTSRIIALTSLSNLLSSWCWLLSVDLWITYALTSALSPLIHHFTTHCALLLPFDIHCNGAIMSVGKGEQRGRALLPRFSYMKR